MHSLFPVNSGSASSIIPDMVRLKWQLSCVGKVCTATLVPLIAKHMFLADFVIGACLKPIPTCMAIKV